MTDWHQSDLRNVYAKISDQQGTTPQLARNVSISGCWPPYRTQTINRGDCGRYSATEEKLRETRTQVLEWGNLQERQQTAQLDSPTT